MYGSRYDQESTPYIRVMFENDKMRAAYKACRKIQSAMSRLFKFVNSKTYTFVAIQTFMEKILIY